MSYYRTCPDCGAILDPCEACDCKEKAAPDEENPEAASQKDLLTFYFNLTEKSRGAR